MRSTKSSNRKKCTASCLNCRSRKKKCDGGNPCFTCNSKGYACEYSSVDNRRNRVSHTHVERLEVHVAQLESYIKKLKDSVNDHDELMQIIKNSPISMKKDENNILKSKSETTVAKKAQLENMGNKEEHFFKSFELKEMVDLNNAWVQVNGSKSVFGPNSVYHNRFMTAAVSKQQTISISKNIQRIGLPICKIDPGSKMRELEVPLFSFNPNVSISSDIQESLALFFQFQCASFCYFLHRESFLFYFLNNEYIHGYATEELLFAICALGARISNRPQLRAQSEVFYNFAKQKLFGNIQYLSPIRSSIPRLQALLCLAIYDMGKGDLTSSWNLSGIAFRMGYDMGFHLDPQTIGEGNNDPDGYADPSLQKKYPYTSNDVKSRIFWGAFILDHYISVLLGRPSAIKSEDSSMPFSPSLGNLTNIEEFLYKDPLTNEIHSIYPCFVALRDLSIVSESMQREIFNNSDGIISIPSEALSSKLYKLSLYNIKLMRWYKKLPRHMAWNKTNLNEIGHNVLLHSHRLFFYLILLSYNSPFIPLVMEIEFRNDSLSPSIICRNIIDEIMITIDVSMRVYGNDMHYVTIPLVYCTILSLEILLMEFNKEKLYNSKQKFLKKLTFLSEFLHKCSEVWELALKPSEVFLEKLEMIKKGNVFNSSSFGNELNNSNITNTLDSESSFNTNIIDLDWILNSDGLDSDLIIQNNYSKDFNNWGILNLLNGDFENQ